MEVVKKSQAGGGVAVKIEAPSHQPARMFGRHFDEKDEVISHISRDSIDVLKVSPRQLSLLAFTQSLHRNCSGATLQKRNGYLSRT